MADIVCQLLATSLMISFPPCKINLGLSILRKRTDGFHDLDTCFYPVPWTDVVEVIESDQSTLTASGIAVPGDSLDNLCMKAYRLLEKEFALPPVKIHVHKNIPMGAGLGGGSADGAYMLRMLNEKFSLGLSVAQLQQRAAQLGSDCAFFIQDAPQIGSGRGEVLSPTSVSLTGNFLVLVKPAVHVSTAEAYAGVKPYERNEDVRSIVERPAVEWRDHLVNDFEASVFTKYPLIGEIKKELYASGALYASMSGSGSTVFGIFSHPVDLAKKFQAHIYWAGALTV